MEPIAYTIDEVTKLVGIGRTKLYEDINAGRLRARKAGTRTLILAADLHSWLDQLPQLKAGTGSRW
jgi:excisionase family DNA binding protein